MINNLYDVSIKTPIANLPGIVTYNNNSIRNEFNYIFDSSNNRLVQSVYVPTGSVKSHYGEFVNLQCDYITINNVGSLISTISNAISDVEHNVLKHVYSSSEYENNYTDLIDDNTFFCHDASVIVYDASSLYQVVSDLKSQLSQLKIEFDEFRTNQYTYSSIANPEEFNDSEDFNVYGAAPTNVLDKQYEIKVANEPYVYNKQMLYATQSQLRRNGLPIYRIGDLVSGQLYAYYNIDNDIMDVNITDKYCSSLDATHSGVICNLKFIDKNEQLYYKIVLSRKTKKILKVAKKPLTRVQLRSIDCTTKYGTEWEVYQYSVMSQDDLIITENN